MFATVVSNNPPNDVMAAWNITLKIVADAGATGTLTFQDPATGTPPNPADYVFGSNGLGIVATNTASEVGANDFFNPAVGPGAVVPGGAGANLLKMTFLATSNASGLFGIYALEGAALTQWTDANFTTRFFTNVPEGTGMVRIGEVQLLAAPVPEPSGLVLAGTGGIVALGLAARRRRKGART
jgi:hypothetical protein